jgi:hypothetical protein
VSGKATKITAVDVRAEALAGLRSSRQLLVAVARMSRERDARAIPEIPGVPARNFCGGSRSFHANPAVWLDRTNGV